MSARCRETPRSATRGGRAGPWPPARSRPRSTGVCRCPCSTTRARSATLLRMRVHTTIMESPPRRHVERHSVRPSRRHGAVAGRRPAHRLRRRAAAPRAQRRGHAARRRFARPRTRPRQSHRRGGASNGVLGRRRGDSEQAAAMEAWSHDQHLSLLQLENYTGILRWVLNLLNQTRRCGEHYQPTGSSLVQRPL